MYIIANILIIVSSTLDVYAVYRQIHKTLKCGDSSDVSTAFYLVKVLKDIIGVTALIMYQNWAGLALWLPGFIAYLVAYRVIIKHKPDNWKPSKIEKIIGGKQ